jgi:hypothetical protein
MSTLQRKIDKHAASRRPPVFMMRDRLHKAITAGCPPEVVNKPEKGKENGACNRTACQAPLAAEPEHQFMDGNFTGGPRLHYCAKCARDFDQWDHRSGDPIRIKRELKCEVA